MLIPLSRGELPSATLAALPADLVMNHVVIGECLAGIRNPEHRRSEEAARWFAGFRRDCVALAGGEATAEQYARLHHHARSRGRPIPLNDLWIAATAAEHQIPLLTGDDHFQGLPGVEVLLVG